MAKKSWQEKLNSNEEPRVVVLDKDMPWASMGEHVLISTPQVFKRLVDSIPKGEFRTQADMREELAKEAGAKMTCPLTSGIFMRIVSEAAWQEHLEGASLDEITPFWRAIEVKSPLAKKLACGVEFLKKMQSQEGII